VARGSIYLHAPLRVEVRCETPAHDERLGLALSIARMRTGIVWMPTDESGHDDAGVVVAYGGAGWLERQRGGTVLRLSADSPGDEVAAIWRATQDHPHRLIGSSRADDCTHRHDLESATVDALARTLAERVLSAADAGREVVQLPVLPGGAPFGIALSHDVDYLATTNRYRATRAFYLAQSLRRPDRVRAMRHFAGAAATAGPWTHHRDLQEERDHGATSEWFVFVRTPDNWRGLNARAYNPEYDLDSVVSLCREIADAGSVVGLHASPQAGSDLALLTSERDRLAEIAGPLTGVRHHMGRFRWPEALGGWLDAGFSYDSSFIINDAQGYRLGTAAPCLLLEKGRSLIELSPNWIDTVSYNYEAETPRRLRAELEAIVEHAALRRSVEGVVWHGIPLRGNGAESVYGSFLARAAALGGLVAPPRTFAEHGRAVLDAQLVPEGDGATLRVADTLARDASVVGAISYEVI
jgi:hypothetical protein